MTYTARDDWADDVGRHNPDVHYRLYVSPHADSGALCVTVICVQDFDYLDYDARHILSPEVFEAEADAEHTLSDLLSRLEASGTMPSAMIGQDMRTRLFAAAVRSLTLLP